MPKATLRFYEELNEYLPPERHKRAFEVCFGGRLSVGDIIEEQGIPEDEVDLVLVNGQSVAFDHVLRDGDRVSVYPVFELRRLKFMAEKDLKKAAERLHAMGFDVYCEADLGIDDAMEISRKEKRILLTTREEVGKSGKVDRVVYVAPGTVEDQVRGILEDLHVQLRLN
jgi:sulfur carrier protein ThiS